MSYHRLSTVIAAVATTIAVAAPVAQAAPARPDDRGLARGAGIAMPDLIERAIDHQTRVALPPDLVDRAVARLNAPAIRIAQPAHRPSDGFDWSAAGIGASTAAGLLVLAGTGVGLARRFRMRSAAA